MYRIGHTRYSARALLRHLIWHCMWKSVSSGHGPSACGGGEGQAHRQSPQTNTHRQSRWPEPHSSLFKAPLSREILLTVYMYREDAPSQINIWRLIESNTFPCETWRQRPLYMTATSMNHLTLFATGQRQGATARHLRTGQLWRHLSVYQPSSWTLRSHGVSLHGCRYTRCLWQTTFIDDAARLTAEQRLHGKLETDSNNKFTTSMFLMEKIESNWPAENFANAAVRDSELPWNVTWSDALVSKLHNSLANYVR